MQDLNDLYYFVQVVEHAGFAAAGHALGIPKSRLSRRVAQLEERLEVRLIHRSTRRFRVTDIGQEYLVRCKAMLVEAEAANEVIERSRAEPSGTLRVTCPVTLLDASIGAMLAAYMVAHPAVTVQLEATNRRVDVIAEGVDVAIRARTPPLEDSDLVMRILAERSWSLVASPRLVRDCRLPLLPDELARFPSMVMGRVQPHYHWQLNGPDGATLSLPHQPRLVTEDMRALCVAAAAGVGVVELPTMVVREALEQGRLVRIMPDWASRSGLVHAVFASRRGLLPSVRSLLDFLTTSFRALDEEGTPASTP